MNLIFPLINPLLHLAILLAIVFVIKRKYSTANYHLWLWFALIHIAESVIVSTVRYDLFRNEQWNWSGKIAMLIAALIFLYTNKKIKPVEAGWALHLRSGSLWPTVGVMILFLSLRLFFKLSTGVSQSFNAETFAFQATLPGLTEELIYRGFLLGLLNKIYNPSVSIIKAPVGWGFLMVSLLFGLVHGVNLDENFHLVFSSQKLLMTFGLGLILAWLKQGTGSIVPAIIFHNLWNLIVFV